MSFDRARQFQRNPDRPPNPLPHTCHCGKRWAGVRTAHCGLCHVTFSGVDSFDRHRAGGACAEPASLGMGLIQRRFEAWGFPLTGDEAAKDRDRQR